MKKLLMACVILSLMTGCSRSKAIQFCEGVSPEGKGVNCGTKFEDGELTAVINSEEPFGVKTITVQVYEKKGGTTEKIDTLTVDVKPDRQSASVNLAFYAGGTYLVRASRRETSIGSAEITIEER
ncbi:MAG TPA: hypothetical protein PLM53_10550 [Spirochaetota bacterium]|nr:hypothetical protein [Spirochaetota bacterium]HPC39291.1 hypothetical protein [Spirochaetota bacterium]HPL16834.1 hypothetical protein [Spirochaetota bacterium]HQF08771.1 hypothetical protein [Spirochaetota bacterium]HQH97528.1 hypothetical protein [Spirochaetota bacterium]